MSEAPDILVFLKRIEHRLHLTRSLRSVMLIVCAALFAGAVVRALSLTGHANPALWAITVLTGVLGACVFVLLLIKELLRERDTLARAAVVADTRGQLKDEISSAFWFMNQSRTSKWVTHQIDKAALTVRNLDPARLVPLTLPRSTWTAAGLALVFTLLSFATPLQSGLTQASVPTHLSPAELEKSKLIRGLLKQTSDKETAKKLEEALSALERKNATDAEKRKALAEAKEAVDKNNMEMNSMREGLTQLAERLRNSKEKSSTGEEKPADRADLAKELLDRMLGQRARQPQSTDLDPAALAREKALEKLLEQASKVAGEGEGQHFESAQPKAVVDRLDKIAQQLEAQSSANQAVRELTQMQQLQVSQTSIQSAGRYSSSQPHENPLSGTPSPDTGNTVMSGGIMFRTAAVAKGDKPSQSQEGSKSGAAAGDSPADPVIGKKEKALAVQLKKEGIRKEGKEGEENESGAEGWFYAESRAQASQVALQAVRANTRYTQGEAMDPEHISVKHRQVVKDYFLNLHENRPEAKPR